MNKIPTIIVLVIAAILLGLAWFSGQPDRNNEPVSNETDAMIRTQVTEFGSRLKNVSLLGSPDDLRTQLQNHYGTYLTPELLSAWQSDPSQALGRNVSSPWPDRIEVTSVLKQSAGTYEVTGNVIEVTSSDRSGQFAAMYPVTLSMENRDGQWLIARVQKGPYYDQPERITRTGTWECLPHKNTTGPQTDECALGLVVDQSDTHYGLDLRLLETTPVDFPTGTRVQVEGVLMPSTQSNQKYRIEGVIAVTNIKEI